MCNIPTYCIFKKSKNVIIKKEKQWNGKIKDIWSGIKYQYIQQTNLR